MTGLSRLTKSTRFFVDPVFPVSPAFMLFTVSIILVVFTNVSVPVPELRSKWRRSVSKSETTIALVLTTWGASWFDAGVLETCQGVLH